jgi:hypothetical protein
MVLYIHGILFRGERMPEDVTINIAKDFIDAPGGRSKKDGSFSGEEFRENFLDQHFNDASKNYKIIIILDGAYGYATSFLEEAFGGLARKYGKDKVNSRLEFISKEEPLLIEEIQSYINDCNH